MAFQITHTLSIQITEADIKRLIIDEIARQDPTIVVDDISFTQKRNPTMIETTVSAHVETGTMSSVPTKAEVEVVSELDENAVLEEELDALASSTPITKKKTTKKDKTPAEALLEDDDLDSVEDLLSTDSEEEEIDPFD